MLSRRLSPIMLAVAFVLLLSSGCGGRALSKKTARAAILQLTPGILDQDEIYVTEVSQTGGQDAIAQVSVKAGFKLEKVKGTWVVREVRLGTRQWERIEDILAALDRVKADQTRKQLDAIATAIERYRAKNGALPVFRDFVSLADVLNPEYLTPLIREDAWRRPLAAFINGTGTIRLVSAGPDGKMGTADDIELARSFR